MEVADLEFYACEKIFLSAFGGICSIAGKKDSGVKISVDAGKTASGVFHYLCLPENKIMNM